jgi:hypothetical protein
VNTPMRLSSPTEIVAAIPALLGFTPSQSVVGLILVGNKVAAVMRVDPEGTAPKRRVTAEQFANAALQNEAHTVLLLAIAEGEVVGEVLRTLDAIREALDFAGIDNPRPLHVPRIEAGQPLTDLDGDLDGVCTDPTTSAVHAYLVTKGRVIESNRDALGAVYAQGVTVGTADMREARTIAHRMGADPFTRMVLTDLHDVVTGGETPSSGLASRVGLLFPLHVVARDAALGLALSDARRAHEVMAAIARQLDGIARSEVLTVAGYFAYVGGDGPRAGVAFDAAFDAVSGHPANPPRLLCLLSTALRSGLSPEHLRDLADSGHEQATKLGVEFPKAGNAND